jgi:hypothetical protein
VTCTAAAARSCINCNGNNCIVEHNVCRKGSATNSILTANASTGNILRDNLVTAAVTDNGDGLHTTGNILIS